MPSDDMVETRVVAVREEFGTVGSAMRRVSTALTLHEPTFSSNSLGIRLLQYVPVGMAYHFRNNDRLLFGVRGDVVYR